MGIIWCASGHSAIMDGCTLPNCTVRPAGRYIFGLFFLLVSVLMSRWLLFYEFENIVKPDILYTAFTQFDRQWILLFRVTLLSTSVWTFETGKVLIQWHYLHRISSWHFLQANGEWALVFIAVYVPNCMAWPSTEGPFTVPARKSCWMQKKQWEIRRRAGQSGAKRGGQERKNTHNGKALKFHFIVVRCSVLYFVSFFGWKCFPNCFKQSASFVRLPKIYINGNLV